MPFYVYMLECNNDTYYTGYTTDIERRYEEHCYGSFKCKYTRAFPPRKIAACWQLDADLSSTMRIEKAIKRLSRTEKVRLVQMPGRLTLVLEKLVLEGVVFTCLESLQSGVSVG